MLVHSLIRCNFAMPAQRISAWTTNCLLTFSVLAATLCFGRQMLKMQARESAPPLAITIPQTDNACFETIQFDNRAWSLCRSTVVGNRDTAVAHLLRTCRDICVAAVDESVSPQDILSNSERQFLDDLRDRPPIDQEPGKWQLHEMSESVPMLVGLTKTPLPTTSGESQYGYRIAIWGIAMPMQERQWVLSIFRPNVALGDRSSRCNDVSMPPGSHKILSLWEANGDGIVSLRGSGHATEWKQFYTDWYTQRGFSSTGWHSNGNSWYADFSHSKDSAIHIRFGPDARSGLSGVLLTSSQKTK